MASILVLDGHAMSSLVIVRSLGRLGHDITVAAADPLAIAGVSRYAGDCLTVPVAADEAEAYVRWIAEVCAERGIEHIYWATTASALALDRFRDLLDPDLLRDLPSREAVELAANKAETARLARSVGVSAPQTWVFEDPAALEDGLADMPMPCVVKPRYTAVVQGPRIVECGRHDYARDGDELRRAYGHLHQIFPAPMIQEYIPGYGFGVFLLMDRGGPVAAFAHRRVREADPVGSGSSFRVSTELPEDAFAQAATLLRAMGWHGVAMVEFRRDARDGAPRVIEVNGRFWFSLALAVRAGVDFPALLLQVKRGIAIDEPVFSYRTGIGCHWLGGEAMHLFKVLKGKPAGYPGAYPTRLRTLASMARDFIVHPRVDSLQLDDMRPAFRELRLLLGGVV